MLILHRRRNMWPDYDWRICSDVCLIIIIYEAVKKPLIRPNPINN